MIDNEFFKKLYDISGDMYTALEFTSIYFENDKNKPIDKDTVVKHVNSSMSKFFELILIYTHTEKSPIERININNTNPQSITPLQVRLAETYDTLVKRANVTPAIYSRTTGHNLYKIPAENGYSLNGFFLAPDFDGTITYCPDEIYTHLFKDTELALSAENIGMIISWNAYSLLIRECQKAQDEAGEHTFKYLLNLLNKKMHDHADERILFLVKQTIDFNAPSQFIPRIVSSK